MNKTGSNEAALFSEIPIIINNENDIIAQGQGKKSISILNDKFCEEHFLIFFLWAKSAIRLLKIFQ